jgi:hypothetical protein
MTLAELRTAVRTRIGNPSTDGFFSDAQLNDLVNEALQAISIEDDWPWLQTSENIALVAGTAAYTPTAGWVRTKQLFIQEGDPLTFVSLAEIDAYGIQNRGTPDVYTIYGDQVLVRPVPQVAATLIHQYNKSEPLITVDGTSPLMPVIFHYAIVAYAAHLAQKRQGDLAQADAELRDYKEWYKRMVSFRRRSQVPMRVRVRPGSWL